jgi:hypothetical protein
MSEHVQLMQDSIVERRYVTRDLEKPLEEAVMLGAEIDAEEWALGQRHPLVERFASFTVLQGLVRVSGAAVPFTSERYNLSGYTYIDGTVCKPTVDEIVHVLATGSEATHRDREFASHWLHQLKRAQPQGIAHVVVGRSYATVNIFNRDIDRILPYKH